MFESTNQNILATLRQPQSIKEWNELMSMMISAQSGAKIDSQQERNMQNQLQLLRNRRKAGEEHTRPINGSAQLYFEMPEEHPQKQRLIEILDDIENSELEIMEVTKPSELRENGGAMDLSRKKLLLANELKLRINRLTEEYDEIMRILPVQ